MPLRAKTTQNKTRVRRKSLRKPVACVYCDLPRRCRARWTENHPRERGTRDTREKHHPQRKIGACSIILFLTITRLGLKLARIAPTALEGVVLTAVEERERRLAVAIEDATTPSRTETNAHQVTGGLRPPLLPTASPAVPPPPSTSPALAAASSSKRAATSSACTIGARCWADERNERCRRESHAALAPPAGQPGRGHHATAAALLQCGGVGGAAGDDGARQAERNSTASSWLEAPPRSSLRSRCSLRSTSGGD